MNFITILSQNPTLYFILIAALGLIVGSFLNVVIYRLPKMIQEDWNQECRVYLGLKPVDKEEKRLDLYLPLSHCTACKKPLKPWHNIPVLSYFVLRGKCAYCHAKISPRYPIVEFLSCIASVYIAFHFGVSLQAVGALVFTWILIALTFIDLDYHLLPDHLTLLLLWIGLFLSLFHVFATPEDAIIGAIAGYLIFALVQWGFELVTGKIGMGQGDFKLLAGLGAYLGWQQLPIIILLASVVGLIFGLIHMGIKRQFKSVPIPFGPYLALSGWVALLWGNDILHIYLSSVL